jgi:hypothetical protein
MPEVVETELVTIPLDTFLEMRDVYEKNKDKHYVIELSINHRQFIDGTKVSDLHTQSFNFPDDTETKLSELFLSVHENSQFVAYLRKQLEKAENARKALESHLQEALAQLAKRSLWSRIFS